MGAPLVLGFCVLVGAVIWLSFHRSDPLPYVVPFALAIPPLLVYGGRVLGWPVEWLSTRVALLGCLVLFVGRRLLRREYSYNRIPGLPVVLPYVFLVAASVIWGALGPYNDDVGTMANEFFTWVLLTGLFFVIAGSLNEEREFQSAGRALVLIGIVEILYAAMQGLVLLGNDRLVPNAVVQLTQQARDDLSFGALRLYGTLPNVGPNFFGAFLLLPTVLAFARGWSQRSWVRVGWLTVGSLCATLIALTYSRGALLGLVVALLMIPLWRRNWIGTVAILGTVTVLVVVTAETAVGRHARDLYAVGQFDVSGSSRVYLWQAVLKSASTHPIGLGFNGWARASARDVRVGFSDPPSSIGSRHPAENQWIRELADRGVLGVFALALLVGGLIRMTFRRAASSDNGTWRRDLQIGIGATYVGLSFVFLTGDHLTTDNVAGMFWYSTALALATLRHPDSTAS